MARSRIILFAAFASVATLSLLGQAATEAPKAQGPQFKDRAEYDLYEGARTTLGNAGEAKKRLDILNQWKEKYPQSDYDLTRRQMYVTTYQQLGQAEEMWNACKDLLAADPKNFTGLYFLTLLVKSMGKTDPDRLDTGEKSARALLQVIETPPTGVAAAEWDKQKPPIQIAAHTSLGWIAMQRKDNAAAEKEFVKVLQMNPGNGEVSVFLGTVISLQKDPSRYSEILFHFARAGHYDGPGGLQAPGRQTYQGYFEKAYKNFHGDDKAGMAEVVQVAKSAAFPPAGFRVKSLAEIMAENEEKFKAQNPMLFLWTNIKKALEDQAGGAGYFEQIKGSLMPGGAGDVKKFKGTIISTKPVARPKEVVVGITSADTPEVTLRLDTAMTSKADPGTVIEFEGVAVEFVREPFNLTFDVEKEQIVGWPAPPPPVKKAPGKAAGTAKKKG